MSAPAGLRILWRGPLDSCNYGCAYCPFAKRPTSVAERTADEAALRRFVEWVTLQGAASETLAATRAGSPSGAARPRNVAASVSLAAQPPSATRAGSSSLSASPRNVAASVSLAALPLSVLFTPWGEALHWPWYQEALVRLSRLPHVGRVAIQTNLSSPLDWVGEADGRRLALWATYHPTETTLDRFAAQCEHLDRAGVRYSVGIVGKRDALDAMEALRRSVRPSVYVWVNRYRKDVYTDDDLRRIRAVDPHFGLQREWASLGLPCLAGETVVSVDGAGDVRRCHFVRDVIGNLYDGTFAAALQRRACPNATCHCHIGYAHLPASGAGDVFGDGVLERVPAGWT